MNKLLENMKIKAKELGKKAMNFANEHKYHKGAFFLYGLILGYVIGLF